MPMHTTHPTACQGYRPHSIALSCRKGGDEPSLRCGKMVAAALVRPLVNNKASLDWACRCFSRLASQERVCVRLGVGGGKWGVKGGRIEREQSGTDLPLKFSYRMSSYSCRALECDPPGFQSDEHTRRGHHGAFLPAKGSPACEDERVINFLLRCWIVWMF